MADYADYDFAQMRTDAVRRVEEMKKRSRSYLEQENAPQQVPHSADGAKASVPNKQAKKPSKSEAAPLPAEPEQNEQENDTFILLLLILILSQEGADQSLIFALLYMLL